jgi:hypothetical protein
MSKKFACLFPEKPQVVAELRKLRIEFIDLDTGDGEEWPALKLPSNHVIAIVRDGEGNGRNRQV